MEITPVNIVEPESRAPLEETDKIEIIKEIPKSNMKILTYEDLLGELTSAVSDFETEPTDRARSYSQINPISHEEDYDMM